ncbi:binding-protein-dependent transporters inner membrane component [Niallia circulans]|jgi:putative aldouronate transport system permease protein|uniref:Sugar ABC transporter permease n=1 Tax=Niallia circulans TaxID=1397 RepID=A0A0J1ICG2_NIACI|nr:carbohydrate ABC transporter permease [Niallia circulans]KLV23664.1 sugar ABC transporter permease [Niallia circulans]MCM2981815.1 carbohydrate ABC transporter permease [Niallia circulans]MDR4316454.1 carbohydrate ABC transporter permease [Niallia circulans]MED3838373.1 carbohydrate ABC transporter permease [Niallia circulans]MED4243848.1 carbohydrate ABC transporter permease [Niallia circulans]
MKKVYYSDVLFDILKWIFLLFFILATLYPILNTLAVSFNDGLDSIKGGIYLFPRELTLENYITVLKKDTLIQASIITVARTVIATIVQLFLTALLAYILSRKEFVFRKSITLLYIFTMYLNAGLIPNYLLMSKLGLLNSFWVYIIPGMISAFNMLVIRTYINGLPESLVESAKMDGASHFRIFISIIMPLCKPVLATVALFIAVYQWNSWFDAMLYNGFNDRLTTLQYELMKLLSSVTNQGANVDSMKNSSSMVTPTSIRAATTIITALPIVCLYPFLQKYFMSGLTIGGVKE